MDRTRRGTGIGRAIVLALAGLVPFSALAGQAMPTPDDAALRARYALPASRFADIDGQSIHYVDQGHGDTIVLIHGSYGSLRQWDGWARALSRRYRVIRFDSPPAGLSGAEPQGDYGLARQLHVIDALTRKLGADRFFLVATSSGGLSGAAFAADHPERVRGLILSNIAVGALAMDRTALPPAFKSALAEDAGHKDFHRPEYWRQIMLYSFDDPRKVTPALVQEWTDLNNRALRMPPPRRSIDRTSFLRTPGDLARITAPTLLLWSANDHETPLETAGRQALSLLAARDKALVAIPACGHMMPLECGAEGLALARPFFDRIAASK